MSTRGRSYGSPETRRRILDATWQLLEEAQAGLRLADVAKVAGVSRQAVYLHFHDRSDLLVALVDHIDSSLGAAELRDYVFSAPTGVESLRRWIETMSWYTAKIDAVTRVLESGQYHDDAQAAAWRNRMDRRRNDIVLRIVQRIAGEGDLASGWTIDTATDLIYVTTMPGPWRELTGQLGWDPEAYTEHLASLLSRALVAEGPGRGKEEPAAGPTRSRRGATTVFQVSPGSR